MITYPEDVIISCLDDRKLTVRGVGECDDVGRTWAWEK